VLLVNRNRKLVGRIISVTLEEEYYLTYYNSIFFPLMNLSQYVQNADFFQNLSNCILSDSDRDMYDKSCFI